MFIVIKSEHYDCTNLICKKDTLEDAVAAVKDSMAQRINKNYHTGLTGADITHENEDHYGFSFTFDENCPADNSEPRAYSTYDYWNGDDQESVEWVVYEVTTDKPFFLLSYEEYESIKLTGFYDTFDEAFGKMKELIAESVNDVFDEDATADDVEDMEDYNVFVHSNKDSQPIRCIILTLIYSCLSGVDIIRAGSGLLVTSVEMALFEFFLIVRLHSGMSRFDGRVLVRKDFEKHLPSFVGERFCKNKHTKLLF